MKMTDIKDKLCDICNQPTPCICDRPPCVCPENRPIKFKDRVKSLDLFEEFRRFCTQEPIYEGCSCPQDCDEIIDNLVDGWVRKIPIYASYTVKEKTTRDRVVSELKNNLKRHVGDQVKCKEDAIKCLKDLPMWLPPDKDIHDSFKAQYVDDLVKQAMDIDIFTERVRKWVLSLPFLPDVKIDKDKVVTQFAKKLKDTAMLAKDLKNDLAYEAYEILQTLPIKICTCFETEQFAEKLAQYIASLPPEIVDGLKYNNEFSYIRKQVEFEHKIKTWVNQLPFDPYADVNREAVTKEFIEILTNIMKNTEPGSVWESVTGYVKKKLHKLKLLGGYREVAFQAAKLADQLTSDMFSEIVSKWVKDIAFDHNSNIIPEAFAYDLTKKLTDAKKHLEPEEVEEKFKNTIFDEFKLAPVLGSIPLKISLAEKLANALCKLDLNAGKIKQTIRVWLKEVPFKSEPPDKGKLVNNLVHKVNEIIKNTTPAEVWSKIKNMIIDEMSRLPVVDSSANVEPLATKLTDSLVAFLFEDAVFGWAKQLPYNNQPTEEIDVDKFATDLCKKLKDAVMYDDPKIIAKNVRSIALESLHDGLLICGTEEKEKIIEDLVDTMLNTPKQRDQMSVTVGQWYDKLPLLTPGSRERVKDFTKKVRIKLTTNTNPREIWTALKQVAIEELKNLQIDCLSTEMEALAENLANMLAPEELEEIVKDWLKSIPYDSKTDEFVDNFSKSIAIKIQDILAEGDIDEQHENLYNTIVEKLNEVAPTLSELQKSNEAERLITELQIIYPVRDGISKTIENWIKTVPFKSEQPINKIKVTEELAITLKEKINTKQEPEDAWFALSEATQERLEKLPIDTNTTIESLGDRLADMLATYLLSNTIQRSIKLSYFDPTYKGIKKELVNILVKELEGINFPKSREKYKEMLTQIIAGKLQREPLMCTSAQMDEIAKEMATKIASLPWKPDNFSKTLHNWAKTVPFSPRPPVDKRKVATSLGIKLRNVIETHPRDEVIDVMVSEVMNFLKKYDLNCKEKEKSTLTKNLVDQLVDSLYTDKVFIWLKNLPMKSDTPINKARLSKKIAENLKPLLLNDTPDKKALVQLVNKELMQLVLETDPNDIHKLIDKLLKLPKEKPQQTHKFAVNVNAWLKGVTLSLGPEDTEELVKMTLEKLRKLRSQGYDEDKTREEIKQDIADYVNKVFKDQKSNPEAKRNLIDKMYKQVFDTFKSVGQEKKNDLHPKFQKSIKDWLAENQEFAHLNSKTKDVISTELASELMEDVVTDENQALIKGKMITTISNTLDSIDNKLKDTPDIKKKLRESLYDKIATDIIPPTRQTGKDKAESQFRVEAIHKVKSVISAVKTIIRNQSLTNSIPDPNSRQVKRILRSLINTNLDEPANTIFPNKSSTVNELLRALEAKSNNNLIEQHEQNIDQNNKIERIIDKSMKNPSILPSTSRQLKSSDTRVHPIVRRLGVPHDMKMSTTLLEQISTEMVNEEGDQNLIHTLQSLVAQDSNVKQFKSDIISRIKKEIGNISDFKINILYEQVNEFMDKIKETLNQIQSTEHVKECLQEASRLRINIAPKTQTTSFQKTKHDKRIAGSHRKKEDKNVETKSLGIKINSVESAINTEVFTSSASDDNPERTLVKDFKIDIQTLLESVPELSNGANEKLCEALTTLLTKVDLQDLDKKRTRKQLQNEIVELLEDILECKREQLHSKTKRMVANQLLDILATYLGALTYTSMTSRLLDVDENSTERIIKQWIQEVTDLSSSFSSERIVIDKTAKALVESLKKIKRQTIDRREIKYNLLCEIKTKLDAALTFKEKQLDNKTKQKYADQLLDKLLLCKTVPNKPSVCSSEENKNDSLEADLEENFDDDFKMNYDKKLKRFTKEIPMQYMQNKNLQHLDETKPSEEKKRCDKTRRNPTHLLVDRLGESTHSVGIFAEETLQNDVKAWFDDISELQDNKAPEKAKNKELLQNLSKNPTHLHSFNHDKEDLQNRITSEVKRNSDSAEKDKLVEELLVKLSESMENPHFFTTSLTQIGISIQNITQVIKELLPEVFLDKSFNERELEKLSRNLTQLFNQLDTSDIKNTAFKRKILSGIKHQLDMTFNNIENYLSHEGKHILAEQILDVVLELIAKSEKKTNISKVFQKDVLSWLEEIPETASTNAYERKENVKTSFNLTNKLADLFASDLDHKLIKRKLLDEIRYHFEDILEKRSITMHTKEISKLASKLANTCTVFLEPVLKATDIEDSVWEWASGIPMFAQEYMPEKRKKVNKLSKDLYKIQKKGVSYNIKKNEMRKEINSWLKEISNRKVKKLDECANYNYITKQVENKQYPGPKLSADVISSNHKVKAGPGCSKNFEFNTDSTKLRKSVYQFHTTPSEVFYLEETKNSQTSVLEISKEIDENTQAKIFELISNNIDAMDDPKEKEIIKRQIIQLLITEADLPETEAEQLVKAIMLEAKEQVQNSEAEEGQMAMLLKDEIRRLMDEYAIEGENRNAIESYLAGKERTDEDTLKVIMEKVGLSAHEAKYMLNGLGVGTDIVKDDNPNQTPTTKTTPPTYNDALQDELLEWIANLPTNLQPNIDKASLRKQIKNLANEIEKHKGKPNAEENIRAVLADKLPLTFSHLHEDELKPLESSLFNILMKKGFTDDTWVPPKSEPDKVPTYNDALQEEIMEWVVNLPTDLQPKINKDSLQKQIKNLANQIEKHEGKPDAEGKIRAALADKLPLIFSHLDKDQLKPLESSLFNNLMKKGFTDDTWVPPKSKPDKDPTYNDALQEEIMEWVANLPTNLQPKIDKDSLQKQIKNIANQIEKHKGKPDAEGKIRAVLADKLPLIFSHLDKDELKPLESSFFNSLMKKGFTDDTWVPPKSKPDKDPTYNDALQQEIMEWVANLPTDLQPKIDKDSLQKQIKNIANQIEKHKGKPDAEGTIRAVLADKLPLIFSHFDKDELKPLESSLFNSLMKKGFTDDTWVPPKSKPDKVPTYNDALQEEIMEWVANLPTDLQPKIDKDSLQKQIKNLANQIEKHKGKPDAEGKIRAALADKLPLIFSHLDKDELKPLESSLFNSLMKKGFTDDTWVPPKSEPDKVPTYNDALQEEIMEWVANLPTNLQPKIDKDSLQKQIKNLANQIEKHKGKPDAEGKIRAVLADKLPLIFSHLDKDELKPLESSLFNSLMKKGFTDDTWTPPVRQSSEILEQNIIGPVLDWLKQTPMYQKASPEEKTQMESAAKEMAKGIKRAVSIAKLTPGADMDDCVREQIMKDLKNVIVDSKLKNDDYFLNNTADNLINNLKTRNMYQNFTGKPKEVLPNLLNLAVDDWTKQLPIDINTPQQQERFNQAKQNFTSRLKQARSQFHPSSPEHEQAIKDEARKFLRANITDPKKKADEKYIEDMANKLEKALHGVPIESDDTTEKTVKPYKSPADTLYDYIEDWVENLPVQGEPEKVNLIKQNLASKLVSKIGELNLNPDIFNDTALYQDLLQDEVDKLLEEIPKNPELNKYLPALKKDFIFKIMDARQKMLEELGGKFYKQHLRDKISTTLPLPTCLTAEDQASLEILKDKVADAFINLHYATCDESENRKYKSQISDELNKFVKKIFCNYSCANFDSENLKTDLYKALTKVSVPRDDSMKSEVEQVRIRDLIYDWMRELPLRQETATEKLHRHKLASVLAKRIHDIEIEKHSNKLIDSEHKIREEILKFLNKLLLIPGQETALPNLVQELMNSLKYTERSRMFISSPSRCQPNHLSADDTYSRYPSTLSPDDQDHLRRIKIRREKACSKDVGIGPPLTNTCSQTDNRESWIEQRTCPGVKRVTSPKYCTAMPQTKDASCMTPQKNPCPVQPRVLVKEFIWESPDNSCQSTAQGIQTTPPILETLERPSFRCPSLRSLEQPGTYDSFSRPLNEQTSHAPNPNCTRQNMYKLPNINIRSPSPSKQYSAQPSSERSSINREISSCYCQNERELRSYELKSRRLPVEEEISSEEEYTPTGQPGPSRYSRIPEFRRGPGYCRLRSRMNRLAERFGEHEKMYNRCARYRMRREAFRSMEKDNTKCNCKDRIIVSCKGHGNRFLDMCQACGNACPHPRPLFFR